MLTQPQRSNRHSDVHGDGVLPVQAEHPSTRSFDPGPIDGTYCCTLCGGVVADQRKHLEWHLALNVVSAKAQVAHRRSSAFGETAFK